MSHTLQCPHCKGSVSVEPEDAGYRLTCPHCQSDFIAPAVSKKTDIPEAIEATSSPVANEPNARGTPMDVPATPPAEDDWLSFDEKPTLASPATAGPTSTTSAGNTRHPAGKVDDLTDGVFGLGDETESLPNSTASDGSTPNPSSLSDGFGENLGLPEFLDVAPPEQAVEEEVQYATEYRIKCRTCGTPTMVKATQAGATVKCTDCFSPMKVPPPPTLPKQPQIEKVVAAPHPAMQFPASAAPVGPRRNAFEKSAEELLDQAEQAEAEKEEPNLDNPDIVEWLKGVFGIFADVGVLAHWLVLSAMGAIPAYLALLSAHPVLVLGMFPYSLLVATLVVASCFAVLESVANDEDYVENWPVLDPMGWFSQVLLAFSASLVAVIPAYLFGVVVFGPSLLTLGLTMFSVFALFPFVVISMLDMESPFIPFSAEVARSVTTCAETWGGTYFTSALLFVVLFMTYVIFGQSTSPATVFITITATIGALFIYFAMIGRLAYAIGQTVTRDDDDGDIG